MKALKFKGSIIIVPDIGDNITDSTGKFKGQCVNVLTSLDNSSTQYEIHDGSIAVKLKVSAFASGKIKVKR